jgi:hypothetical protein
MCREVEGHLAMVFHRFLSGEARARSRLRILVNGSDVVPWDPFARSERATKQLNPVHIQVGQPGQTGEVTLEPFLLPHQGDFSSPESFRRASGPANWNQQQGFYVYRSDRLIQSGGWCRIRTLDEHTKLARVALHFSPRLDHAFRVNVSKMRIQLPTSIREELATAIAPVTKLANDLYRRSTHIINGHPVGPTRAANGNADALVTANGVAWTRAPSRFPARLTFGQAIDSLLSVPVGDERRIIRRVAARLCR